MGLQGSQFSEKSLYLFGFSTRCPLVLHVHLLNSPDSKFSLSTIISLTFFYHNSSNISYEIRFNITKLIYLNRRLSHWECYVSPANNLAFY